MSNRSRYLPFNEEALRQAIRVLREVEDDGKMFNIGLWVADDNVDTAACAIGWCCRDAWFMDRGLRMTWQPATDRFHGWYAVAHFFQITEQAATELFSYMGYDCHYMDVTPRMVIEQIERVLASGEHKPIYGIPTDVRRRNPALVSD